MLTLIQLCGVHTDPAVTEIFTLHSSKFLSFGITQNSTRGQCGPPQNWIRVYFFHNCMYSEMDTHQMCISLYMRVTGQPLTVMLGFCINMQKSYICSQGGFMPVLEIQTPMICADGYDWSRHHTPIGLILQIFWDKASSYCTLPMQHTHLLLVKSM